MYRHKSEVAEEEIEPPCKECIPPLMSVNEDARMIYYYTQGQVIVGGMGTVIDVMYPSIAIAMDMFDVDDKKRCFKRVVAAHHHFAKKRAEEQENNKSR
jgi:hypothetical protein